MSVLPATQVARPWGEAGVRCHGRVDDDAGGWGMAKHQEEDWTRPLGMLEGQYYVLHLQHLTIPKNRRHLPQHFDESGLASVLTYM